MLRMWYEDDHIEIDTADLTINQLCEMIMHLQQHINQQIKQEKEGRWGT